jgi:PilZ domain
MDTGKQLPRRLERRWAPRYSFRADLEIEWGSAVLSGKIRDISANGMFIEAVDTLWIGAGFTARLNLDRPVKVNCSVKRIEPGFGMGVAVAMAESENQEYYQQLLDSLAGNPSGTAL